MLIALLNGLLRFFATIFSPAWYACIFANVVERLRSRGSPTNPSADALAKVEAKARRRKFVVLIAVLVIGGSLVSLYRTMIPSAPKVNRQPFVGLGQVLGEETVKALNDRGRVVIVTLDEFDQSGNPMNDALAAFRGILKKHPNIGIAATEVIRFDANNVMMPDGITSGMFNELLEKHSAADGLVFFTGLPSLESQSPMQLPATHQQIIVFQNGLPITKSYFERHIVNVAISPWFQDRAISAAAPQTPREWFDRYFHVVTTQNYTTLPN